MSKDNTTLSDWALKMDKLFCDSVKRKAHNQRIIYLEERLWLCGCCNSSHEMPGLITFNGGWALGAAACSCCIWSSWTPSTKLSSRLFHHPPLHCLHFMYHPVCPVQRPKLSRFQQNLSLNNVAAYLYFCSNLISSTFVCYDRWIRLNQNVENHQFSN